MIKVIKALPEDHNRLTEISFTSKRYWNYPEAWIQLWKDDLTINPDHFQEFEIFKLEESGLIIGFCALSIRPKEIEVEHLWLIPEKIGKGLGRQLLETALTKTIEEETNRIIVVADPNAVPFYDKFGFTTFDQISSSPGDRKLPVMQKIIA